MTIRSILPMLLCSTTLLGCPTEDDLDEGVLDVGDGDGDGDAETGGDGDGDPTTGDGDGDPTTGDGDGDPTTGDGDGDPTSGDGDGDPTTGDGDGDPSGCTIPDPGWAADAAVGQPAPHFSGINHLGDQVSICAYEGMPIVIDTSAVWCGPCQMMSACLGGDDNYCLQVFGGNQDALTYLMNPLREAISAGTFAWVTVLMENANGGAPSLNDAQVWDQNFPAENVWVIPDVEQKYYTHVPLTAFPSIWLMDEQMRWQDLNQMTVFNTIINEL